MPNCAICGERVMTGVVLHSECYAKLIKENEKLKFKLEDWKYNSLSQAEIIAELVKKNERLTTENAELKARLEKSVELPIEQLTTIYYIADKRVYVGWYLSKVGKNSHIILTDKTELGICWCDNECWFTTKTEAEKALKERNKNN